ncbi:MAG TPA: hypothetical protein VGC96_05795 [Candidatus Elarobacter sp.]|jgi:hypothetical protein
MNNRTNPDEGATDEPALTERNTETIRGEETLADETTSESNVDTATAARTGLGAVPSSYGAAGGTTDATEEGGDGTGI